MDLGWVYQFPGRWDESIEQLKRTLEMDRTNVAVVAGLGWAHLGKGMHKEAEAALTKEAELIGPSPDALVDLGCFYGLTGDTSRALLILDKVKKDPKTNPLSGFSWVVSYLGLAARNERYRPEMYRWLDKTAEEHSFYLVHA